MNASHPTLEELLAHRTWLERLARRLADTEADAEDLVQETWLRALRRPPAPGSGRTWLGTVLRNLATDRRRAAREIPAPEHAPAAPAADEGLERLEIEQLLGSALMDLDREHRDLLLARYRDGRSSAAIGRELGLPATTVRSRLAAATERLRADLDRRSGGDRSQWLSALGPLLRPSTRAAGVSAWAGAALLVGAAALLVAAGVALSGSLRPKAPEIDRPELPAAVPTLSDAGPGFDALAMAADRESLGTLQRPAFETLTSEEADPLAGDPVFLRGCFEFPPGVVPEDIPFELQIGEGSTRLGATAAGSAPWELTLDPELLGRGATVRLAVLHDTLHHQDVTTYTSPLLDKPDVDFGTLELTPAASVHGRILWARAGPMGDVRWEHTAPQFESLDRARLEGPDQASQTWTMVRVERDGTFSVRGLPRTTRQLWLRPEGGQYWRSEPLEFTDRPVVRGLVADLEPWPTELEYWFEVRSPDGAPYAEQSLRLSTLNDRGIHVRGLSTDANGGCVLPTTDAGPHDLFVSAINQPWSVVEFPDAEPGGAPFVLRFAPLESKLEFTVRREDGTRPDSVQMDVSRVVETRGGSAWVANWSPKCELGPDGSASVLVPSDELVLQVRESNGSSVTLEGIEASDGPIEIVLPNRVELSTPNFVPVRGVVQEADGRPVVGALVCASNGTLGQEIHVPTDNSGAFEFELEPGAYELELSEWKPDGNERFTWFPDAKTGISAKVLVAPGAPLEPVLLTRGLPAEVELRCRINGKPAAGFVLEQAIGITSATVARTDLEAPVVLDPAGSGTLTVLYPDPEPEPWRPDNPTAVALHLRGSIDGRPLALQKLVDLAPGERRIIQADLWTATARLSGATLPDTPFATLDLENTVDGWSRIDTGRPNPAGDLPDLVVLAGRVIALYHEPTSRTGPTAEAVLEPGEVAELLLE